MRRGSLAAPALAAVLAVLALFTASLPGAAWHVADPPDLLHSREANGPGWVMYRLDPAGEHVEIDLEAPAFEGIPVVEGAVMVYDEDLSLKFGNVFTFGLAEEGGGAYVDARVLGDENPQIDTYQQGPHDGFLRIGQTFNRPGATGEPLTGTHYVALWVAGGVTGHAFALHGADGVELHEVTEGDSAYYYTTQDFEGPFTGRSSAGLPGPDVVLTGAGVRAVVNGTVEHTVEGTLLGIYSSGYILPTADDLSVDRPDGTTRSCPCSWDQLAGADANGPGDYTLRATGAAATINGGDQLRASVIDVQVPNQLLQA